MPDLKAIDVSERTEKELFIWPLQPPLYIQYKHQAFIEHLPYVPACAGNYGEIRALPIKVLVTN